MAATNTKFLLVLSGLIVVVIVMVLFLLNRETPKEEEKQNTEKVVLSTDVNKEPDKQMPDNVRQANEMARRRAEKYQREHPMKPTIPRPTNEEEAIQRISDKKIKAIDRVEAFNWLKENDRTEALKIAEMKSEEYTARFDELQNSGDDDTGPLGDLSIGLLSAELVMEDHLEKMGDADPVEKMRYVVETAWEKKWMHAHGKLSRALCDDIEGRIAEATIGLHPYAADTLVMNCNSVEGEKDYCPIDCAKKVWSNFKDDWSYRGFHLKMMLYFEICRDNPGCPYLNEFLDYFRSVKDKPLDDELKKSYFYFVQKSSVHCLPFEEFLKKAEETGNKAFVETLKKKQPMYERFRKRCGKAP